MTIWLLPLAVGFGLLTAEPAASTLPPGTSKDRVRSLRKAFTETMKGPELIADARKSKLGVDPIAPEEIEKNIAGLFKLDSEMIAKLKEILYK